MPTFATDPNFESPTLLVGNAVASVAKDIRLYSTANTYGATLGAPTPLTSSQWGVGNASGTGVYALEVTGTAGTSPLPLTLERAKAVKIQWKSRDRGQAYTSRVVLMNPRTGALIDVGGDQSGLRGCGGGAGTSFDTGLVPFANDAWCELQFNLLPNGKVGVSYSKWKDGEAPGTHAAGQTLTGTSAVAVIDIIDDGFVVAVRDNATSLYKYRYWIGTPDAPATGLASIAALRAAGWRWSGSPSGSMFPITVKSATTEHWRRDCVMGRGGTHIGIVLFGMYGNSDTPVGYTTSVQVRKNGGSFTVMDAAAVVPAGDVKILTLEYAHVAGDTITFDGTQSAGTQLPVMDPGGFYPYAADALGNAAGLCFGVISLVSASDGKKSVHCLTDSLGVGTASESAYEAGCGVFNQSVGGCKIGHVIAGDGGLKRYLLDFGDITMIKLSANDMNVDLATTAQLLERESWLMKMPGIASKPVIRWFVAPCATPTHVALGSGVWAAVATQPRLHNALDGPAYGFAKTVGRDLYGLFIDGASIAVSEDSMRVWKAGASTDGVHYASGTKTSLKNYARDQIIAWLPTIGTGGGAGRLINGGLIG